MRSVFVDGREWFDRVNGNSYFSARVYVDGFEVARIPFQYGYGSAFKSAAAWALQDLEILPGGNAALWQLCRDTDTTLYESMQRVTKRECDAWGRPWAGAEIIPGRYARPFTLAKSAELGV